MTTRHPSAKSPVETVLLAVTGMSPAVITETAWALAMGNPRVMPARVIALTTTEGRRQIREALLASDVWNRLRAAVKARVGELEFGDTGAHIRVFARGAREMEDIRSPEDNLAAADFILETLRGLVENPEVRVVASIAGGRKTMSALLYACMSLVGREQDRVTHVLVPGDLERRRDPPFFFPARKSETVELADIPFVPLRHALRDLGGGPGSFRGLVARYARALDDRSRPACVSLEEGAVSVDDTRVELGLRPWLTLAFLVEINLRRQIPPDQLAADPVFKAYLAASDKPGAREWAAGYVEGADLRRELSHLREKLGKAGLIWMPGLRARSLVLPPFRIG
jgi:CRISPR-associated protein (TIGR02584 family)